MEGLGTHIIAELFNCNAFNINNLKKVEEVLMAAAELSKATIIQPFFHKFSPYGISGVIVIAESHITIHTWPEYGYAAVDVFTCGNLDYKRALDFIKASFETGKCDLHKVYRGSSSRLEVCYADTGVG